MNDDSKGIIKITAAILFGLFGLISIVFIGLNFQTTLESNRSENNPTRWEESTWPGAGPNSQTSSPSAVSERTAGTPTAAPEGEEMPVVESTPVFQPTDPALTKTPEELNSTQSNLFSSEELGEFMLGLINKARGESGLGQVEWDAFAAGVATMHAEDMAQKSFFSHWNLAGWGPDHRYAFSGGAEVAIENIHFYYEYWEDGTPIQLENFESHVEKAHESLMNSPGHRKNILDPAHTHVGVGFSYNPDTGRFYVVQEFINRYIVMDPLLGQVDPGAQVGITGKLLERAENPLLNVAYEPFPKALTKQQLAQTSTYSSAAELRDAYNPSYLSGDTFGFEFPLGNKPGLYHLRIWVDIGGEKVHTINWIVRVE